MPKNKTLCYRLFNILICYAWFDNFKAILIAIHKTKVKWVDIHKIGIFIQIALYNRKTSNFASRTIQLPGGFPYFHWPPPETKNKERGGGSFYFSFGLEKG